MYTIKINKNSVDIVSYTLPEKTTQAHDLIQRVIFLAFNYGKYVYALPKSNHLQ